MKASKNIRSPAVAGYFYNSDSKELVEQIEGSFKSPIGPGTLPKLNPRGEGKILSLISPHAGYIYSGPVAAHGFLSLADEGKPDLIVLIGPNHTGYGSGVSIMDSGSWRTPLGVVEVDEEMAQEILRQSTIIDSDELAHMREHSIEVQIPFLQYVLGDFRIVPIAMLMQDLETSREVGKAVAKAMGKTKSIIVASSDMTHYEPQHQAEKKDKAVLEAILKLDEERLISTVHGLNASVCGYGPIAAAITASKNLGASHTDLLKYATSGDVTRDFHQVVGYASLKIMR